MIWLPTAYQLAATKMKTRKIRLLVTLVISSILFAIILTASLVMRGAVSGIETFSKAGFGNRYIASGYSNQQVYNYLQNPTVVARAEAAQKQLQADKKAEAKRLELNYDPANDMSIVTSFDGPGGKKEKAVSLDNPTAQGILADYIKHLPGTEADFKKTADSYGAIATYSGVGLSQGSAPPYIQVLKDGQEDYSSLTKNGPPTANGLDSISMQWQLMSKGLLKPFLLKGQSLEVGAHDSIPIIAPYSAVEQLLGLKPLPSSATAKQQLARLKEVRSQAAGYSFSICYRNSTSSSDLQTALQQQQQIANSKGQKDFVMPDFVQDKPAKACGSVTTTRDIRTTAEKDQAANQAKFDSDFGKPAAFSQIVRLRIVGLNSDIPQGSSISVNQILQSVLVSSLGTGWFSPIESADSQPVTGRMFNLDSPILSKTLFAEFSSGTQLKKFLDQQNCQPDFSNGPPAPGSDPFAKCTAQHKYFSVYAFGSSSTALDDFKRGFSKVFAIAGAGVAVLAALIMMGTVGRIIADSRRETAVFRALGAKRLDIAEIYIAYVAMIALLVFIISLGIASVAAYFVNHHYSQIVTVDGLLAFNVADLSQKIVLMKVYTQDILYIAALIVGGAVMAALFPILNNVRRNPIKDMRDDR